MPQVLTPIDVDRFRGVQASFSSEVSGAGQYAKQLSAWVVLIWPMSLAVAISLASARRFLYFRGLTSRFFWQSRLLFPALRVAGS
eukprot:5974270-Prorocentrum_lima.AAC.1